MSTQSLTTSRGRALLIAGGAFVLVFILWQWTSQSPILYPLRLFVTFVHEAGHGLAAILTGGRFERFQVFSNGAGLALTGGGSRFLILQMGYLGAALFGAILLYATNRAKDVRWVALAVGLFFATCAFLFTGKGQSAFLLGLVGGAGLWWLSNKFPSARLFFRALAGLAILVALFLISSEVALLVGIIGSVVLIALGLMASRRVIIVVLNLLALIVGFNAIDDIWSLMSNRTASLGPTFNDAYALATLTHTPVEVWILLWTVLAIVMMGMAIYLSFVRSRQD